jgi:outer membrane protein assembly factor BamB
MQSHGDRTTHLFTSTAKRARRLGATAAVTTLALAGLAAWTAPAGAATPARAGVVAPGISADETTAQQNLLRNGWDPNEPTLTPAVVNGGTFGQVFKTALNGQVYAQPLVVGSTVIVATDNDWVYGLNATTGAILWKTQLGTPFPMTTCNNLVPNIGVTAAPVYDPSTNTVYVMGLVKEISYQYHLFGINATTGAITFKQRIAGSPTNNSHLTFNPTVQNQRDGLLLMNGWVYAGFASFCDHGSYNGYVAGVNVSTSATTLWADEAGTSNEKGGIWQGGGGIMSDGPGRILVATGNGVSPPKAPGSSPPGDLAESVVRLAVSPTNGSLSAQDFFSPSNAPSLDSVDHDLGGGGPVGLPFGTATYPDILAQAGKQGEIYILNGTNLGGREQGPGGSDAALAEAGPYGGQWGNRAAFGDTPTLTTSNAASSNDYLIYVGKSDFMREFKFGVSSTDTPTLKDVANSSFTLGYTSGTPVITSNGTDATTGIIWAVDSSGTNGTSSTFGAWDLLPQPKASGGVKLREIWSAPIGTASKFTTAATANGMVYVGTRDGNLYGFGILGAAAALTSGGTVTYPDTQLGSTASATATLTATSTATVTGATVGSMNTPDPYTVGQVTETHGNSPPFAVQFPVTLHKGDALHAQVNFAPVAPGGAPGQVTFATSTGSGSVSVPLIGDGTQTGLYATQTSLSFVLASEDGTVITNVPVGIAPAQVDDIVNGGDTPVTVTSVTAPTGPYTVLHMPRVGTVIKPGGSVPVQITYAPQQAVTSTSSFTVTVSNGTSATVNLTGTGLPPVTQFTASPSSVNFGSVPVGQTATVQVTVTNAGNQPSLMQPSALPGQPFGSPLQVASGLPVNGGYTLVLPVTFHPTKAGAFSGTYTLRWTDEFGKHTLAVPITGTGV